MVAVLVAALSAGVAHADEAAPSVARAAAVLRFELSADTDLALSSLDPASRSVVAAALGEKRGDRWSPLMSGAMQVTREASGEAATLWYNPVFEAGLSLSWRKTAQGWTVTSARWMTSDALGAPASPCGRPIGDALVCDPGEGFRARAEALLSAADPLPLPAGRDGRDAISARVAAGAASLDVMRKTPGDGGDAIRTLAFLGGSRPSGLPQLDAVRAALGPDGRATLRAVAAYRVSGRGWTVVAQTPNAPGLAIFVRFAPATGAPPPIETVRLARYASRGTA